MVLFHDGMKNLHHRGTTALRADYVDPGTIEDERTDPVLLRQDTPGAESRGFRSGDRLHVSNAAEEHAAPLVHEQQGAALALLGEDAAVGLACACGDLPIDLPNIIPNLVTADFFEVHSPATQSRRMPSGKKGLDRLPRKKAEAVSAKLETDQVGQLGVDTWTPGRDVG